MIISVRKFWQQTFWKLEDYQVVILLLQSCWQNTGVVNSAERSRF